MYGDDYMKNEVQLLTLLKKAHDLDRLGGLIASYFKDMCLQDEDDYYEFFCLLTEEIFDDFWMYGNEEADLTTLLFADTHMRRYIDLCRTYGLRAGLEETENPYIEEAFTAVRKLDISPQGSYGYFLRTDIPNKRKCAIVFQYYWSDFYWDAPLVRTLLDIYQFFRDGVPRMEALLAELDQTPAALSVPDMEEAA